jgi:hypothetical protein
MNKGNLGEMEEEETYYIIPINKKRNEREREGKEREKSFLFCLYVSYIQTKH